MMERSRNELLLQFAWKRDWMLFFADCTCMRIKANRFKCKCNSQMKIKNDNITWHEQTRCQGLAVVLIISL